MLRRGHDGLALPPSAVGSKWSARPHLGRKLEKVPAVGSSWPSLTAAGVLRVARRRVRQQRSAGRTRGSVQPDPSDAAARLVAADEAPGERRKDAASQELPAAVRFISYEPALGPLVIGRARPSWIICGGERGGGARYLGPRGAR